MYVYVYVCICINIHTYTHISNHTKARKITEARLLYGSNKSLICIYVRMYTHKHTTMLFFTHTEARTHHTCTFCSCLHSHRLKPKYHVRTWWFMFVSALTQTEARMGVLVHIHTRYNPRSHAQIVATSREALHTRMFICANACMFMYIYIYIYVCMYMYIEACACSACTSRHTCVSVTAIIGNVLYHYT
jgi:hypothetical protein